jgi:hypothetical protein
MGYGRLKLKKNNIVSLFIYIFCLFLVLYFIIYFFFIYPLYNLSTIQTKDEIRYITDLIIQGATDKTKLYELTNIKVNDISFYYNYFIFKTNRYTIWCTTHKHNKFSNNGNIVLYYYDNKRKHTDTDILYIDFNKFQTYLENGKLIIKYLNNYKQVIDFDENKMQIYISTSKNELKMELYIDEYNTTMPPLLNRYKNINKMVSTSLIETQSPNEWASDNPLIGKIIKGYFNNDPVNNNSNFWFDNFIGCNNFFLSEYYWFVIMNDEWLIYILYYGKYEDINSPDIPIPLFIKNRKENKIIHCSPGVIPNGFKTVEKLVHPIYTKYTSNPNKRFGDIIFDEYTLFFESNEITINITSIPNNSVRVLLYDYYIDPNLNETKIINEWDKNYNKVLNNLAYVEYINRVNVEILYNNKIQKFQEDHILDAIIVKDNSLPSTIKYK